MKSKQDVILWIEQNGKRFTEISDKIWEYAEPAYKEFKSSKIQADFLEKEGFKITWDLGGINTSFSAEWGSGKPIIGFLGEYDALMGLSQKSQPTQEPVVEGAPGHGCGHNMLGTGPLAACTALKQWMTENNIKGTIRYYGCPAEEVLSGKTFMARAGVFDDLDVCYNYHPASINMPSKGSSVGLTDLKFRFHGKSAHAGGSPHLGRSALDAVELMNVGVNYLREHVTSKVRMHYVITHGGDLPNVVPPEAEVWYFIRAHKPDEMQDVLRRVRKIAEGAALMTETRMEEIFQGACSHVIPNFYLADLQYENMKVIGPIEFSDEEMKFAQTINDAYPDEFKSDMLEGIQLPDDLKPLVEELKDKPLWGANIPAMDEGDVMTGSTDMGDVSHIAPQAVLYTATTATEAAGHSWGVVATGAMSIGHKGMLHAAKIIALTVMDLLTEPEHLEKAKSEFEKATEGKPYVCPIPDHVSPPVFENPER